MNTTVSVPQSQTIAEKANAQYLSKVIKEQDFLINRCFPSNISHSLKKINALVSAAKALQAPDASEAVPLSEEDIERFVVQLSPLRELEMVDDAAEVVRNLMTHHKIGASSAGRANQES